MSKHVMSRRWRSVLLALVIVGSLVAPGTLAPAQAAVGTSADDGARVTAESRNGRILDLTITGPALDTSSKKVRLWLPPNWSPTASRTWPTLWLLHGGWSDYKQFLDGTDIESWAANRNVIIVMPDTSWCSDYSNWWNNGSWGKPAWETFLMTEVWQILQRGYRAGGPAAIAGYSMGGEGSMKFPVKYPGRFVVAAALSGHVDPLHSYENNPSAPNYPQEFDQPGGCPFNDWKRVWGDPRRSAYELNLWKQNDPYELASSPNLANVQLFVGAGSNGDFVEAEVYNQSRAYVTKLEQQLGHPVDEQWWSSGGHGDVWKKELQRIFPKLMTALGA